MFILKLRYFFTGYLVISVQGTATEKFINLAMRQGIPLWDLARGSEKAVLKVDMDSFFELRHLAKKTGCRLKILQKAGLPFLISRSLRRRGLIIGISLFIVSLYLLSSLILFVSVEGTDKLDEKYIRSLAGELGARPGVWKASLDKEDLANEMILLEPKLTWVGFHVRGTRLIIEVVEKIKPPVENDMPGNVVAAKDGLVVDVLIVMGEARVQAGDTVSRGQILIEGLLVPQSPFTDPEDKDAPSPVPVHARGEVLARVWYEGYGEANTVSVKRNRTGKRSIAWSVIVDGQSVLRVGRSEIPYANYELASIKRSLPERIFRIPVEIITEYAYEIELEQIQLTREQTLDQAAERARILAEFQLPVGVAVESVSLNEVETGTGNLVGVQYIIETLENIAEEEDITGGDETS
ncbi:MAG: sporulation protein YqfD [Clostridiales bacterium]|nr:sporulation protein YqfD [Clostridiales bacterium]